MTSILTCQVCLLPLNQCRENDKKLIKPFKKRFKNQTLTNRETDRHWRVFCYVNGSYDPVNNEYHLIGRVVSDYTYRYGWVKLPLCAYEGCYDELEFQLNNITFMNICRIPMDIDYVTILNELQTDAIISYVSSLPTSPR